MSRFDRQVAVQVQGNAILGHQVMCQQLTLTLHEHEAALLETETEGLQHSSGFVCDLSRECRLQSGLSLLARSVLDLYRV